MDNCLIIFSKSPLEGKVKTRLGKSIGNKKAAEIYKKLPELIIKELKSPFYDTILYVLGDESYFKQQFPRIIIKQQQGKDLGRKLYHAFKQEFEKYKRVVVIGTDCPDLELDVVEHYFKVLGAKDAVIGPAKDGGYYMLGLSKLVDVFHDIAWSTVAAYLSRYQ